MKFEQSYSNNFGSIFKIQSGQNPVTNQLLISLKRALGITIAILIIDSKSYASVIGC